MSLAMKASRATKVKIKKKKNNDSNIEYNFNLYTFIQYLNDLL